MVTYIAQNGTAQDREYSIKLKAALEEVFKYTKRVNVHAIFNFKSPIDVIGKYHCLLFIDIPYEQGNYFRSRTKKVYLNSLALALRYYEDSSVINIDNHFISNENGSWNYVESIKLEKEALIRYVFDNIEGIKHFSVSVIHELSAPNCKISGRFGNLVCNRPLNMYDLISSAVEENASNDGKKTNCLVWEDNQNKAVWNDFLPKFMEISNGKTTPGKLSLKKINLITSESTNQAVKEALEIAGNKLCIIEGKAGTGKSFILMKLMYHKVKKDDKKRNHRCRFLTYNNMLVMDIKQTIKNMGVFTQTNASISTLHKYFFDIYIKSPVSKLHMDDTQIKKLFAKCHLRVTNMITLMYYYHEVINSNDIEAPKILDYFKKDNKISKEDYEECKQFCNYLYNKINQRYVDFSTLNQLGIEYEEEKRQMFMLHYAHRIFLNGYNKILEELYLMYHNLDEFISKYGLNYIYSESALRETVEFKKKYEKLYDDFMKIAREKFMKENNLVSEDMISAFFEEESSLLQAIVEEKKRSNINIKKNVETDVRFIQRTIHWSDLVIVDEAQDCPTYEKALLMELQGPNNLIIASGGNDQLIRTSIDNPWTQLFGKIIPFQIITLDYVHRQKANIVRFVNEVGRVFNYDPNLKPSEATSNQGRVIIDVRVNFPENSLPTDMIEHLYSKGIENGCCNFENIMFLIPRGEFLKYESSLGIDVNIDSNDTISFHSSSRERKLAILFPDFLNVLDGTVNDKRDLLNQVGYNRTRCLLYESCRGSEAWNVMCIDLDTFFYDRLRSSEATEYASESAGLFQDEESIQLYKERYAVMWILMALTRSMDTLYIKLSSRNSTFSQKIIDIGRKMGNVEILEGIYGGGLTDISQPNSIDDLPF